MASGDIPLNKPSFLQVGDEYNVTTLNELKTALQNMASSAGQNTVRIYKLRTIESNDETIPKSNYCCIVAQLASTNYGQIIMFSYGASDIFVYRWFNLTPQYNNLTKFTGTNLF